MYFNLCLLCSFFTVFLVRCEVIDHNDGFVSYKIDNTGSIQRQAPQVPKYPTVSFTEPYIEEDDIGNEVMKALIKEENTENKEYHPWHTVRLVACVLFVIKVCCFVLYKIYRHSCRKKNRNIVLNQREATPLERCEDNCDSTLPYDSPVVIPPLPTYDEIVERRNNEKIIN